MTEDSKTATIRETIDSLTADEDVKQDLWLAILSHPNDLDSIIEHFISIQKQHEHGELIRQSLISIFSSANNPSYILDGMSSTQQSIVSLVILGFDIYYISNYKNIDERRVVAVLKHALKNL